MSSFFYFSSRLLPCLLVTDLRKLLGYTLIHCAIPRHRIKLALDVFLAPHSDQRCCLVRGPPSHERKQVDRSQNRNTCTNALFPVIHVAPVHVIEDPIHFNPDRNHLLRWFGIEPVRIRFDSIHLQCRRNECALIRIKSTFNVQCRQALTIALAITCMLLLLVQCSRWHADTACLLLLLGFCYRWLGATYFKCNL